MRAYVMLLLGQRPVASTVPHWPYVATDAVLRLLIPLPFCSRISTRMLIITIYLAQYYSATFGAPGATKYRRPRNQSALVPSCIQRLAGQQFLVDAKALLGSLPLRGLASSIASRLSGHGSMNLVSPGVRDCESRLLLKELDKLGTCPASTVRLWRLRFRRRPLGDSFTAR